MIRKAFILCLSACLLQFQLQAQVYHVAGKITDAETGESLAFVNVVINNGREGTTSDINGRFSIHSPKPIQSILFSFVGYDKLSIDLIDYLKNNSGMSPENLPVKLKKSTVVLKELVFEAGENPANRIIRKAVENKKINNPERIKSFSYKSYNKFIVDAEIDEKDLEQVKEQSEGRDVEKFLENKYLFLMESVTERKYKYPDRSKEVVLANRVSGLKNPMFTTLANSFQPFAFYNDYITILNKNFLNPLSKGSFKKYFFNLEDSIYSYGHKVYIISFEPRKKNFEGLKGLLYINTYKYALENVIAETPNLFDQISGNVDLSNPPGGNFEMDENVEPPQMKRMKRRPPGPDAPNLILKIQQKYTLIDSTYWFPSQLNTDIVIGDASGKSRSLLKGMGRSYLTDIRLFDDIRSSEFDRMALEYDPKSNKRDSLFWAKYRIEPLDKKEKDTYVFLDSIGKEAHLDRNIVMLGALTTGKIPVGVFDFDINRFLDFNLYEYVRMGVGVHTSNRLSKFFNIGGYGAWAFGDKEFKYGGDLALNLTDKNDVKISFLYSKDLMEAGGTWFYKDNNPMSSERRRRFVIENFDRVENMEGALSFYFLKYLDARIAFSRNTKETTTGYRYLPPETAEPDSQSVFDFAEIKVGLKYSFREKYVEILGNKVSMGSKYPIIWFNYTKGFDGLAGGAYNYHKFDFKLYKSWLIRGFGKPSVVIRAGYAVGDIPYSNLYNGNGSYDIRVPLEMVNSFMTMRTNEFLSDRYAALYFTHNFGLIKLNPRRSTPEFIFITNIGIGSLSHPERHIDYPFKTMEKGYFESGLSIRKIVKIKGLLGFGVGAYYRYGPYGLDFFSDNIAVKATLDLSF